jgi:hypothetical protein
LTDLAERLLGSTSFAGVEPPHTYLQQTSASVVHHRDYLNRRDDHALCGVALENPATLSPGVRPVAMCPDCEAKVVEYHLTWWRERAEAASAELDELRAKYRDLAERVDNQHRSEGEDPDSRRQREGVPQGDSTAEEPETEPTTFLGHARRELLELCRQFDGTVPYWRLKNTMQAFSDKLTSDERVLLAHEIGADGSLIRWCTTEIESRGWRVADNPVSGGPESMMDAWIDDAYQTPKKTRWRLGRSRSHGGT